MVRVVPDVPAIHRRFDYAVPAALAASVGLGSRVRVPLHGRRVAAWVVADDVTPDPGVHPLELTAWSGAGPPPSVLALADWAAWRWAGPVSSFLGTASPPRVVRDLGAVPARPTPPASPGGGSGAVGAAARAGTAPAVVRLAPALDSSLLVLELVSRTGPDGGLVVAASRQRADHLAARLRTAGGPVAAVAAETGSAE